jgi:hypothetical protein
MKGFAALAASFTARNLPRKNLAYSKYFAIDTQPYP